MASAPFVLILGMHRSGTSCLAGALEACGLRLGEVGRSDRWNAKGNREHDPARLLNDRILEEAGASWSCPPARFDANPAQRAAMAAIVGGLAQSGGAAGLKEPRVTLLIDAWSAAARAAAGEPLLVGTYRHPSAVAASLAHRNQIAPEAAHALWLRYNVPLIERHRARPFPIVAFDLSDPDRYCATVAAVARRMGLAPDLTRMREFVSAELDHGRELDPAIPASCRAAWDYLESVREPWASSSSAAAGAGATAARARTKLHFISGPTCAGKSQYLARHGDPGATVLLPDRGALAAVAAGGRFLVHYNLLRPFDKLLAEEGAPPSERFRRFWRRIRSRVAGPFAIDRRLKELLAVDADFEATVLVVPRDVLLARIAQRRAVEPLREVHDGYPTAKWDAIVRQVDLVELHRAWLRLLRERAIPFRLVDARDASYRPIADERELFALLAPSARAP